MTKRQPSSFYAFFIEFLILMLYEEYFSGCGEFIGDEEKFLGIMENAMEQNDT